MPSRGWVGGSTRAWRKTRLLVLERDGYLCQLRLPGEWTVVVDGETQTRRCTELATQVHHLDGKAAGDDPDRCVAACRNCNLKVGDPTGAHHHRPHWRPRRPQVTIHLDATTL